MAKKILESIDRMAITFVMKNTNRYSEEEIDNSISYFEAVASKKEIEEIRKFYHRLGGKMPEDVNGDTSY